MGSYMEAGKTGEFQDGSQKKVTLQGQEIMLARVGGNYYAIAGRCPHMGGDLWLGRLEGTVITCPRHGSQFDIKDGHNIRWTNWTGIISAVSKAVKSPRPVRTYKVKVEGDKILVEV